MLVEERSCPFSVEIALHYFVNEGLYNHVKEEHPGSVVAGSAGSVKMRLLHCVNERLSDPVKPGISPSVKGVYPDSVNVRYSCCPEEAQSSGKIGYHDSLLLTGLHCSWTWASPDFLKVELPETRSSVQNVVSCLEKRNHRKVFEMRDEPSWMDGMLGLVRTEGMGFQPGQSQSFFWVLDSAQSPNHDLMLDYVW